MDIEERLIELAERMSSNIDKQSEVNINAMHTIKTMFKWFCVTLVVITLIYGVSSCLNEYNRLALDYDYKIEDVRK